MGSATSDLRTTGSRGYAVTINSRRFLIPFISCLLIGFASRHASAADVSAGPAQPGQAILNLRSGLIGEAPSVRVDNGPLVLLGAGTLSYGLLNSGTHTITVVSSGNATPSTSSFVLSADEEVTAVLYTSPSGSLAVGLVSENTTPIPQGESRVSLYDLAQYGGSVDIYDNGILVARDLTDTSIPGTASVLVPAGPASFTVTVAGQPAHILATLPGHFLLAGLLLQVLVVGNPTVTPSTLTILTSGRTLGIGYRLYASDGGVFAFGDAGYDGSAGSYHLNKPVVGAAPDNLGLGYWLVASDGGIFTFGDAKFYGSTGSYHLNKPIVSMFETPDSFGYDLVATDGGIFTFGDAKFYGSTGGYTLNAPIVAGSLAGSPSTN